VAAAAALTMAVKSKTSQSEARRRRLLSMMADGEFHSGEALAKRLRISRAAIWKLVQALRALSIEVQSVPRQGYRLARAVDLLERDAILKSLAASVRSKIERLDVPLTIDSTNRFVTDLG
jgi:BirA family biotin operon repressor/biotin-[acetyl-CoA-carboxylase] ligase